MKRGFSLGRRGAGVPALAHAAAEGDAFGLVEKTDEALQPLALGRGEVRDVRAGPTYLEVLEVGGEGFLNAVLG